jgi:hypothetical protein
MKTMKFFAAVTIALAAMSVSSCNNKQKTEAPEGTPIGEGIFLVEQIDGDGYKTCVLKDSAGYALGDIYASVENKETYLVATKHDGIIDLLTLKGRGIARCIEFTVLPYYPTTEAKLTGKFIKTDVGNGNHLAYDTKTHEKLIAVEGLKEDILPLDNGYTLFKLKGLWGIAQGSKEEPIISDAKEIVVITNKDGIPYFWVNYAGQGSGLLDGKGNAIKPISGTQMKNIKRKATVLWEEGPIAAIVVKSI